MAVTQDMVCTWRAPRAVMRKLLADGPREDRAVAYVMVACLLIFVAQWPRLAREAAGFDLPQGAEVPDLQRALTYALFAWVMIAPLLLYLIAAASHLVARVFGGKGSWYTSRIALFWTLLATTPLLLLHGLLAGFVGPSAGTNLVGALWLGAFIIIWALSLYTAEQSDAV